MYIYIYVYIIIIIIITIIIIVWTITIPLIYLVGGLDHFLIFQYIGNVIIPTDELIFFRGVGIPPTSIPMRRKNNIYIYIQTIIIIVPLLYHYYI